MNENVPKSSNFSETPEKLSSKMTLNSSELQLDTLRASMLAAIPENENDEKTSNYRNSVSSSIENPN